jgi:hypothetical protein
MSVCLACSREIVQAEGRGRPRRYCDDACRALAARARARERYALVYDRLAERRRRGLDQSFGSVEYLERRAAELRGSLLRGAG